MQVTGHTKGLAGMGTWGASLHTNGVPIDIMCSVQPSNSMSNNAEHSVKTRDYVSTGCLPMILKCKR